MFKISPQKQQHIIKSASASTKSFSSPDTSAAISQLTAPISQNTNQQPPKVIYISADEDNKPMSPLLRLTGSLLATAGIIGGIVLGLERHHNGQIRKAVVSHIENYTSADNPHLRSIQSRGEIYKLCQKWLARADIPQEHKDDIHTFLEALKINPNTGNIKETHILMKDGNHYIHGLTELDIERAAVKLEELFSIGLEKPIELSEKAFQDGDLSKEVEKRELQETTVRAIQEYLGKINHIDKSMPAHELKNPYLALEVLANASPEGKTNVLNPVDNKPFSEKTKVSHLGFSSLNQQQSPTSYYSDPFFSNLMLFEMFDLFHANRY